VLQVGASNLSTIATSYSNTIMHESTLDLFCNHDDGQSEIDAAFDEALEERAAALEITVDYYLAEFF